MKYFSLFIVISLLIGCGEKEQSKNTSTSEEQKTEQVLPSKYVAKEELYGLNDTLEWHRKQHQYSMVEDGTHSDYKITVNENQELEVSISISKYDANLTFGEHIQLLDYMLDSAQKDYDLSKIRWFNLGGLGNTGDVAIESTKIYIEEYGSSQISTKDYKNICNSIIKTPQIQALNNVFNKYGDTIKRASIEKAGFWSSESSFSYGKGCKVETDSSEVPEKIITGMVGIYFY